MQVFAMIVAKRQRLESEDESPQIKFCWWPGGLSASMAAEWRPHGPNSKAADLGASTWSCYKLPYIHYM